MAAKDIWDSGSVCLCYTYHEYKVYTCGDFTHPYACYLLRHQAVLLITLYTYFVQPGIDLPSTVVWFKDL